MSNSSYKTTNLSLIRLVLCLLMMGQKIAICFKKHFSSIIQMQIFHVDIVSMHASFDDLFILAFCICWYRFNNYMKQQRSTISSDLILVRRCTNYFTHAIFLLRNQDIWDIEIQWHAYKTKSSVSLYFNITSQNSSRKCMMSYNYSIGHKGGKPTDQKVKLYLHLQ